MNDKLVRDIGLKSVTVNYTNGHSATISADDIDTFELSVKPLTEEELAEMAKQLRERIAAKEAGNNA